MSLTAVMFPLTSVSPPLLVSKLSIASILPIAALKRVVPTAETSNSESVPPIPSSSIVDAKVAEVPAVTTEEPVRIKLELKSTAPASAVTFEESRMFCSAVRSMSPAVLCR